MLSKAASNIIFWVFGMTQPGIEPRSPRPLANTLNIMPTPLKKLTLAEELGKYIQLVQIQSFSSPRLVAKPRLKYCVPQFTYSWVESLMPFTRARAWSETQKAAFKIWTLTADCIFRDDNQYRLLVSQTLPSAESNKPVFFLLKSTVAVMAYFFIQVLYRDQKVSVRNVKFSRIF